MVSWVMNNAGNIFAGALLCALIAFALAAMVKDRKNGGHGCGCSGCGGCASCGSCGVYTGGSGGCGSRGGFVSVNANDSARAVLRNNPADGVKIDEFTQGNRLFTRRSSPASARKRAELADGAETMKKYVFSVSGMSCAMCESHINDAIRNLYKVKSVKSDRHKGETTVVAAYLDTDAVISTVHGLGYDASLKSVII